MFPFKPFIVTICTHLEQYEMMRLDDYVSFSSCTTIGLSLNHTDRGPSHDGSFAARSKETGGTYRVDLIRRE